MEVKNRMNTTENGLNGLKDKGGEPSYSTKPKLQINGNYEWKDLKTWV